MSSEIIREFLVSVGVEVDEGGMARFGRTVESATKIVAALGAAVAAAATATAAAVVKISDQFDDLYYASQRLRASVTNIKAFEYGVSQMGGTAQDARASLEGLREFMRANPGGEGFIQSLGVGTRDSNGALRDTTDIMRDLGDQFRTMPFHLARLRAGMLGIGPGTLDALIRGTDLWSKEYADLAGNLDEAAEASARFMQMIRRLRAEIELGVWRSLIRLQEAVGPGLERAGKIAIAIIGAIGRMMEGLLDLLSRLDEATDGWSTTIIAVAAAFAVLAATLGGPVTLVLALVAAIGLLIDDFNVWKAGGESLIDWGKWAPGIDAAISAIASLAGGLWELTKAFGSVIKTIGWVLGTLFPFGGALKKFGEIFIDTLITKVWRLGEGMKSLAALMRGDFAAASQHAFNAAHGFAPTGSSQAARAAALASNDNAATSSPGATGSSATDALNYFMRMGWTREQAAGLVANLQHESNFNASAVGDGGKAFGIAQWHPDRQAEFKKFAGKDIRNSTLQEQLEFVHWELTRGKEQAAGNRLRATKTAGQAGAVVSQYYERPANAAAEAAARGRTAEATLGNARLGQDRGATTVNVNSKTDITVNGAADPKATGKVVETAADRAAAKMVRNTQGAVR